MKNTFQQLKIKRRVNGITKEYAYNTRQTKNATGHSKTMASQCKALWSSDKQSDRNKLQLFGNFDSLHRLLGISKKIKIEHPTDKGYFKEVHVLSDIGKTRLRIAKRNQKAKI
jgi:hypothetical protein